MADIVGVYWAIVMGVTETADSHLSLLFLIAIFFGCIHLFCVCVCAEYKQKEGGRQKGAYWSQSIKIKGERHRKICHLSAGRDSSSPF